MQRAVAGLEASTACTWRTAHRPVTRCHQLINLHTPFCSAGLTRLQRCQTSCSQHRRSRCRSASVQAEYGSEWATPRDSYVVLGLAHCFEKDDDGKLADRMVIEPISANSLEAMTCGAKTCFTLVYGTTLGQALARDQAGLPAEFGGATWCNDYDFRADAAARTWLRSHAQDNLLDIVPLGQTKGGFNYNLDEKRVLNFENVVNDDDNVKQDMSIDVYGRKKDDDDAEAGAAAAQPAAEPAKEEDDLDALLMA